MVIEYYLLIVDLNCRILASYYLYNSEIVLAEAAYDMLDELSRDDSHSTKELVLL